VRTRLSCLLGPSAGSCRLARGAYLLFEETKDVQLKVVFRGMEPSQALEGEIRERVTKLERLHQGIISCHVAVEAPRHKGAVFEVRVDIVVPGQEIVAARGPGKDQAHENAYVALRDAFDAAKRQLEAYRERRRREVKQHEPPDLGHVVLISRESPEEAYGFLETSDGMRVYFHRNAVVNGSIDGLGIGDEVRYVLAEGEGEKGPQASTVRAVSENRYPVGRTL
jgi:ribosomal subunit interface protein